MCSEYLSRPRTSLQKIICWNVELDAFLSLCKLVFLIVKYVFLALKKYVHLLQHDLFA